MAGSISVAVASDQSAIPVSDNGGSLTVDGPLTDAQLRAAAVPVSGGLTDAELRATPVPVSGTLGILGAVEVTNDAGNPLPVSAASLPLPTGASTSANQVTTNTSLASIDFKLATEKTADFDTGAGSDVVSMQGIALPKSGGAVAGGTSSDPLRVDPTGTTTQPVSASSLPLPMGAASSENQLTVIGHLDGVEASLASIDSKTPASPATAGNQTTANTALVAIQTSVETIDNAIAGSEMQVDVVGSLPAGDNNIGNVDVLSLPSIPAGTNNIGDVDVLSLPPIPAGTNNIGDVDVLTLPAIPSGDNSIGRVKLTDGTDVADILDLTNSKPLTVAVVDGAGSHIVSFGGGTQYDEDTASAAADKLTMAGVVRKDSAASLVDSDGDRTQLQVDASGALRVTGGGGGTEYTEDAAAPADPAGSQLMARRRDSLATETTTDGDVTALNTTAKGELYVKHVDLLSVAVSGVATAANQSTQTGLLSSIRDAVEISDNPIVVDDAAFSPGTSSVSMVGAEFDDDSPDGVDEGDAGALRMSANRNLYTQIRDAAGNERGVNVTAAGALQVDPSGVTQPVSIAATIQTDVVDDATRDLGKVDVASLDQYTPVSGRLPVDGSGVTQPVSGTVTANLSAGTNTNEVVGDVAEDAALAGNPLRMGMRASTAIPTAMSADGDAVTPWANRSGAQVMTQAPHVGLNSDPWNQEHECAQYTTTQTSTVLVDAAAGEKIVITDIQIQVGGTTAGTLQVYFGTGAYSRGTNRAVFDGEFAPSSTSKPGVIMKGPFISGTNGDDLRVTTSAAINPLTVSIWFYRVT